MKKYYLLKNEQKYEPNDINLCVWSNIFHEIEDRISISSKECKKDFKNIKIGDEVLCFDPHNLNVLCTALVIRCEQKKIDDFGVTTKCITLEKNCKKITLKKRKRNARALKLIQGINPALTLIEIKEKEYQQFLD